MTALDIELTAACNRLRIMIRNEQQLERNTEKWNAMAKTSTIQRRIKMKLAIYRLMYRITNNRKWIIRYIDEMDKRIREDIEKFRKNK